MLEDARDRIGELLGANTTGSRPDRVVFTSGGTEANNLAIRGLLPDGGRRFSGPQHTQKRGSSFPRSSTPASHSLADHLATNRLPH